jgi:GH15 family glucan-1,4-alpha-glucosidase
VTRRWTDPDRGIWEVRGPPRHYVHSKLMAWVALDRSVDLAERFSDAVAAERWAAPREAIREWIMTEGYDRRTRSFVRSLGEEATDAANLRIPLVGFLPFEDPRVRSTISRVRRELSTGPFVYRYRTPDAIDGPEGSFLPAAFWMVECLARLGQRRQAFARWRQLLLAASPLGLYPEEFDPTRQRPLGNFPQAFTHIGVLRAAVALGATEMPSFLEPAILR